MVVEAAGVGYHLIISLQTYSAIEGQSEAKLYTHFIVREDAQILYGFYDKVERELFRLMLFFNSKFFIQQVYKHTNIPTNYNYNKTTTNKL